jgi:hypothetical protein
MKSPELRSFLACGALISAIAAPAAALALPNVGDVAPGASIEDADGRVTDLGLFHGRPILILYEDRDSAKQNQALKEELARLARANPASARVALAPVADVSSWDFQPAKYFVRAAIRDESRKQGTTIYCDWTGAFREAYRLRRGVSNVVLVGKDGRVSFAAEGALQPEQRARLFDLLLAQIAAG